ncbi:MAG TPA: glycosyltransferase [Candidatus Angelobacter sp.]|nr:glycosyltransferase [Candidatus Angelobacter sp.]
MRDSYPVRVSMIMTHYRCERYLAESVESVLKQTMSNLELLLLDDCSESEEWLSIIEPFRGDRRLRVYRSNRNVGTFQLRNRAAELTCGGYLAFQDADDLSNLRRLELQLRELEKGIADIVGCGVMQITEDATILESWRMPRAVNFWIRAGNADCILGATIVLPKDIFESLGGFDSTMRFGADTDFILRAAHRYRLRNVKEVLYIYRLRQGSLCRDPQTGLSSQARADHDRKMWRLEQERRNAKKQEELDHLIKPKSSPVCFDLTSC